MTAQITDCYKFNGEEYKIVASSMDILFNPEDYGLEAHMSSTACWRGYWCDFNISEDGIVLDNLYLYNMDGNYPPLNGIEVSPQEFEEVSGVQLDFDTKEWVDYKEIVPINSGHRTYGNLNIRIPFEGKLLLGKDFLRDYYIHMGFQQGWAYKTLIELEFKDGKMISRKDLSYKAEEMRKIIDADGLEQDNLLKWIGNSFSTCYESKAQWLEHI